MSKENTISIVILLYNEEKSIPIFMDEIHCVRKGNDLHIMETIIVNDGSIDNSEQVLGRIAQKHS